jgi:hypothetical protein
MAKSRKAKKKARKKTVRKGKPAKRAVKRKTRRAKPQRGPIEAAIGTAEEAAALRRRLVGRNTFEDD